MRNFLDNLENAAYKLRDFGKQALQNAADGMEKARPSVEASVEKAAENAKNAFEKAKPSLERAAESAKAAFEKAKPELKQAWSEVKSACSRTPNEPNAEAQAENAQDDIDTAPESEVKDAQSIDLDVEEQVEKIRAARMDSNIISDYIAQKFGNKKD